MLIHSKALGSGRDPEEGTERVLDEALHDHRHLKADCHLVRRAIVEGWNIPEAAKQRIVAYMTTTIVSEQDHARVMAAAKFILAADAQDQAFQLAKEAQDGAQPASGAGLTLNVNNQAVAVSSSSAAQAPPPGVRDVFAELAHLKAEIHEACAAEQAEKDAPPAPDLDETGRELTGLGQHSHPKRADEQPGEFPVDEPAPPQGKLSDGAWTMPDREDEPRKNDARPYHRPLSGYLKRD